MGVSAAVSEFRRRRPAGLPERVLRRASFVALAALLAVTAVVTWLTDDVVGDQEHKLVVERSQEISLILQQTVASVSSQLTSLARLATYPGSMAAFQSEATADLSGATTGQGIQLLSPLPGKGGWRVVVSVGAGPTVGRLLTGQAAAAAARSTLPSLRSELVATPVYGNGAGRTIGFALAASNGQVIYRETILGPTPTKPRAVAKGSAAGAFSDVEIVLYASSTANPAQVITSTAFRLPLTGSVYSSPYMAGASHWLLEVRARQPLVGSVAHYAPWAVLIVGLAGAGLVFVLMESMLRRRNAALLLYQTEHRFAETLQRRLLSPLVAPPGLDVASRYVAASDLHQVGGDWFDVFTLADDRVGVVIGDVMGHDVEAAAAMAQVRAGLRAYAIEGGPPAEVVGRLASLIEAFEIALLVTVVYGVIDPPARDGSRALTWANAGHLPPLLHQADGTVTELLGGTSPVLGAPCSKPRSEGSAVLPLGSTLLLYTDGLVEVHGVDLSESLASLCSELADGAGRGTADQICEAVLQAQARQERNDDIALVAVQVETARRDLASSEQEAVSA